MCQEIFSPRPPRGGRVRSCLRVLDGGAINLSVRCVWASAAFCAVYVVLFVGTSSRAFLPRFPLRPFPRYSIVVLCARARGSVRYVCSSVSECNLFSLAYFMMSLYLILTVKVLLFTLVFRYATAVNLGIIYTR